MTPAYRRNSNLVLTMPTTKTEADLLELMRADRVTLDERLMLFPVELTHNL
jgi:hypothetical protein